MRLRRGGLTSLIVVSLVAPSCASETSLLEPAGPGARRVEALWWPMLWISVVVFLIVGTMVVVAIARARRTAGDDAIDKSHVRWGEPFIAAAGVFVPAVVLGAVFLYSLNQMNGLAADGRDARITIEVTGHDWWWEIRYPNGAVSANEIHIPTGEPVRIELTSDDVIHSFWVPRLQVKADMIPGSTTELWLQADEPGTYHGICAEYCGLQHTNMLFRVVAESPARYDAWVAAEAEPAGEPGGNLTIAFGEQIFMESSCAGCHAIRGTDAQETLGPDLTHLASRSTIGAGMLPNTRANLRAFVADAQDLKPGATMPAAELTPEELGAVVAYLETLD